MAQNITLLGNSYPDVPSVTLPKTGGGTASFTDVTDTTAAASDVAQGKYFYTSGGVKTEGTASGGGGGGAVEEKDVNFYDYDGTLVASYTSADFANLSALPSNPSHTGLTAQGWNWSLSDAKTFVNTYGALDIGQNYVTSSGDTEIDIDLSDSLRLAPYLGIAVNGTVTVDWGDSSATSTVTGTSLTNQKRTQHTYATAGKYTITIHVVSGSFAFYGTTTYTLLNASTSSSSANRIFGNKVTAVRMGSNAKIGNYGFYILQSLETITIPTSVTSLPNNAFQYCYSLKAVIMPSDVTTVGSNTCGYCYDLKVVSLPKSITSISNDFVNYCSSLKKLIIPGTLTTISQNLAGYCYALEKVILPSTVTSIGANCFQNCYILKNITLPSGVTSIGASCFSNSYGIHKITLPSSLQTLGNSALYSLYGLTSLTIPSTVTSLGNSFLGGCYAIKEVHVLPAGDTLPTLGTTAFSNIPSDAVIYVPSAKLNDYKTASQWSNYASYMQGE